MSRSRHSLRARDENLTYQHGPVVIASPGSLAEQVPDLVKPLLQTSLESWFATDVDRLKEYRD